MISPRMEVDANPIQRSLALLILFMLVFKPPGLVPNKSRSAVDPAVWSTHWRRFRHGGRTAWPTPNRNAVDSERVRAQLHP